MFSKTAPLLITICSLSILGTVLYMGPIEAAATPVSTATANHGGQGITEAELPLSWHYSYHLPISRLFSGANGQGYYQTMPPSHGLWIKKIGLPNMANKRTGIVTVFIDGVKVRALRYSQNEASDSELVLSEGLEEPIMIRPGQTFSIHPTATFTNTETLTEISLATVIIPASELPPIPSM